MRQSLALVALVVRDYDDFQRDYAAYRARGVEFVRDPVEQPYGTVAVFRDPYGNLWDLLEPAA